MLSLEEFKKSAIATSGLKSIVGGDRDTEGGLYMFGKVGASTCDIDNGDGTVDHWWGHDQGWIRVVG